MANALDTVVRDMGPFIPPPPLLSRSLWPAKGPSFRRYPTATPEQVQKYGDPCAICYDSLSADALVYVPSPPLPPPPPTRRRRRSGGQCGGGHSAHHGPH